MVTLLIGMAIWTKVYSLKSKSMALSPYGSFTHFGMVISLIGMAV